MTIYSLTPYLADEMPRGWRMENPADALVDAEAFHKAPLMVAPADSVEEALSDLYEQANIGEVGWASWYRRAKNRSLSVGDVVKVQSTTDDVIAYWVVMPVGFEEVEAAQVVDRLSSERWYDAIKRKDREEALR